MLEKIEAEKNLSEFMDGLTELSKKHNLWINGCGCCSSPWVAPLDDHLPEYEYDQYDGQAENIFPKDKE